MSGRGGVLAGSLLFTVSTLSACSFLLDSGLSGGDGAEPDGSTEDGSREAARDDEAPLDAGSGDPADAADAADAAPWCVNGPNRFCDDFDDAALGALWTRPATRNGEIALDGAGLSLPNALRTTASGLGAHAYLAKRLAGDPTSFECELDVKLVELSTTGQSNLFEIFSSGAGIPDHKIFLMSADGSWWCIGEYQAGDEATALNHCNPLIVTPPIGSWFHMKIAFTPTTATVSINGASRVLEGIQPPPVSTREIRVGHTWTSDDASSSETLVDNVDCRF